MNIRYKFIMGDPIIRSCEFSAPQAKTDDEFIKVISQFLESLKAPVSNDVTDKNGVF